MQLTSGGRTRHFSDCINFPKIVPISTAGRSPLVWSGFLAPLISTLKTVQSHTTILLLESPCSLVRPLPKNIASKIYAPYIHASFRIKVQDHMCIIYTCIRVKVQDHRYVHHSHMHQSQGSRNIDKCIIGMCIMVTCIRAKNICISHAYKHQGQESYIHACFRVKVQDHRYVHHTHMHQSQGSRIIDMCIIHTCIRVKDQGS